MNTLPVIAAVDGSDDSLVALDWAFDTARMRGAPLRLVHVRQYAARAQPDLVAAAPPGPPESPDDDPVLDEVRRYLQARPDQPPTEYVSLDGAPRALLPELGSTAQLLVLGSRGRGGFTGLILGSNAMAAARDAECPVVVVPKPGREVHDELPAEPGRRVVVGLHPDSPDDATLAFAFTEAAQRGARLQVIATYPWPVEIWTAAPALIAPPDADQNVLENETRSLVEGFLAPHRANHPEVRVEPYLSPGDAAGLLVAASQDAELVVVGRHRRRLLAPTRLIGSVTHAVLLHAASPIAVVPPAPPEE
jgi:nucleotide-binding universal stress UspA family protein